MTDSVILHVVAELSPCSAIADVDNLLKPILDALTSIAWIDDTQICELFVRRVPSRERLFRIKLWQIPRGVIGSYMLTLMESPA